MASLIEDLARRLDTSPDQARRRLQMLLAALRSQVNREGQVSLPGLGTFSEKGDTWTFEPAETLAHSVNRSFDDLEPVGVSGSANPPAPSSEDDTPAHRDEAWSQEEPPSPSESQQEPPRSDDRTEAPARSGFAGPEASSSEEVPEETPAPSESSSSTSSLWYEREERNEEKPSPADLESAADRERAAEEKSAAGQKSPPKESAWAPSSGRPNASGSAAPSWNYAALPAGALVYRRATKPDPGDVRADRLQPLPGPGEDAPEKNLPGPRRAADRPSESPASSGAPEQEQRPQRSKGSSVLRWLATLVVLLAVGLGVWYVLGQQGTVTGPVATLEQAGVPIEGMLTASPASPSGAEAAGASSALADTAAAGTATADTTGGAPPAASAQAYADAERLDRAQGGWTVVVASETSRDTARRTAQQFAQRFQQQDYPIDILETSVGGIPRYRVVVGQFSSSAQASQTLQEHADRFPGDAWGLEINPNS